MCPNCGAPVTTALQGGTYQCGFCRTQGTVGARNDARVQRQALPPAEEQARIQKLRFQYEQGPQASPYTTFVAPTDVMHLAQLRPPNSWGPWFEAWKWAVAQLAHDPSPHNQKRVSWLAQLTTTAVLDLTANDPVTASFRARRWSS